MVTGLGNFTNDVDDRELLIMYLLIRNPTLTSLKASSVPQIKYLLSEMR